MNQNLPLYLNLLKILTRYINSTNIHRIQREKRSEVCRLWHFGDKKSDFLSNSIINTRKSGYLHMSMTPGNIIIHRLKMVEVMSPAGEKSP